MKNNLFRGLFVVLIGVLLIALNEQAMPFLVRLLGVAFCLPALVSLINLYKARREPLLFSTFMMYVVNAGSVIFGILLLLFPVYFLNLFVILLALALLCFSLLQIYAVTSSLVSQRYGWLWLVMPSLLAIGSIIVLFNPFSVISTASIIIGICIVLSGLSDVAIFIFSRKENATSLPEELPNE